MIIGSYKGTAAMGSIGVKRLQGYYRVLYVLTRMVLQARNVQSRAQQTEALQLKNKPESFGIFALIEDINNGSSISSCRFQGLGLRDSILRPT